MRIQLTALLSLLSLAALTGCGGSSSAPYISDIQANQLAYAQTTQFNVMGEHLDSVMNVTAKGCKSFTTPSASTSSGSTWNCVVAEVGAGAVSVQVSKSTGEVLFSKSFDVPNPQVKMVTNLGTLNIELNPTAVPVTSANFLQYVNAKFYDNTLIHRIVTRGIFVAQGGWLKPAPAIKPGLQAAIALEVGKGLSNVKGTIAMARSSDLNSATSQFFFNLADNTALDTANGGYAVFGKVISGSSVLDAMAVTPTSTQYGLNDFPNQNVIVLSVTQTQ
jgi:cyclophilin family peptidyl-prolyl cis-trans isomerase